MTSIILDVGRYQVYYIQYLQLVTGMMQQMVSFYLPIKLPRPLEEKG